MDRGGWRAIVHGVEKNRKRLSMHVCMQGEGVTQKTHLAEGFQGRGFKGNIWGKKNKNKNISHNPGLLFASWHLSGL